MIYLYTNQYLIFLGVFRAWCCAVDVSYFYSTRQESQEAFNLTIFAENQKHLGSTEVHESVFELLYDWMLYPNCQIFDPTQAQKAHELLLEMEGGSEQFAKAFAEMVAFMGTPLIDDRSSDLNQVSDHFRELLMATIPVHIRLEVASLTLRLTNLQNNSLFLLDSCYGLAAYTAREGDEVFLLKGLDVPVVLRPTGENYSFIGPCSYIHGVMEGQRWPEDESELQDLVLV
ncbi:uncharacterized protein EAE97_011744 [Botrytis byssoidea]|uniref:Uncharacterized protein n=1 Tax=Botrytis byssoidea TaxID=139641 RepID=A0A9P5LGL7_9HELO|nr:uncharacterized protein EAE97_011744 [Botrytis byssoidea]KAF7919028.1 hypothetical protein EAE97_011744 [Botrytis byssoidea]